MGNFVLGYAFGMIITFLAMYAGYNWNQKDV